MPMRRVGVSLLLVVCLAGADEAVAQSNLVFNSGFEALVPVPRDVFVNPDLAVLRRDGNPVPTDPDGGSFRIKCHASHLNYDDSIVYPGQSQRAHLHLYMGNTATDASHTSIEVFRRTFSSTCQGGYLNQSGYWIPAVLAPRYANGELVLQTGSQNPEFTVVRPVGVGLHPDQPDFSDTAIHFAPDVYYKAATDDLAVIQPMPEGLRFIAGNMLARPADFANGASSDWQVNSGSNAYAWRCESWEARTPRPQDSPHIPNCSIGDTVNLFVRFPMCWNGRDLDAADHRAHMAFSTAVPRAGGGWTVTCPTTHPVALPQVSYNFGFPVTTANASPNGDSAGWRLSSDMYAVSDYRADRASPAYSPGGYSAHGDWFMAWHPEVMQALTERCIRSGRNCTNGNLGNGFALQGEAPRPQDFSTSVQIVACGMGPAHSGMGPCR